MACRDCDNVTISAVDDGTATSFIWKKNGVVIQGENNRDLVIEDVDGIHTYTVVAVNSQGCGRESEDGLRVEVIKSVIADFEANIYRECVGQNITFSDSSIIPDGATNVTKLFEVLETNENASGATAVFNFATAGTYTIRLTVTTDEGCDNSIEKQVVISEPAQSIITALSNTEICEGQFVELKVNPIGGNSPHVITWFFNRQEIADETDMTLRAYLAGFYSARVSNTGSDTCSRMADNTIEVFVNPTPVADFTLSTTDTCTES